MVHLPANVASPKGRHAPIGSSQGWAAPTPTTHLGRAYQYSTLTCLRRAVRREGVVEDAEGGVLVLAPDLGTEGCRLDVAGLQGCSLWCMGGGSVLRDDPGRVGLKVRARAGGAGVRARGKRPWPKAWGWGRRQVPGQGWGWRQGQGLGQGVGLGQGQGLGQMRRRPH